MFGGTPDRVRFARLASLSLTSSCPSLCFMSSVEGRALPVVSFPSFFLLFSSFLLFCSSAGDVRRRGPTWVSVCCSISFLEGAALTVRTVAWSFRFFALFVWAESGYESLCKPEAEAEEEEKDDACFSDESGEVQVEGKEETKREVVGIACGAAIVVVVFSSGGFAFFRFLHR